MKQHITKQDSELDKILEQYATYVYFEAPDFSMSSGIKYDGINTKEAKEAILTLIKTSVQEADRLARIDEISRWFDMPKHYKGEEYRDEPFVKAKCKTPNSVRYQLLDNHFTYAVLNRINQLKDVSKKENK